MIVHNAVYCTRPRAEYQTRPPHAHVQTREKRRARGQRVSAGRRARRTGAGDVPRGFLRGARSPPPCPAQKSRPTPSQKRRERP